MKLAFSDVAFLLAPLILGFGTARLFSPQTYVQCGKKSPLQPPGWVFGVAWTILYLLVGVAAFLAWRKAGRKWTPALVLLAIAFGALIAWWLIFANVCLPTASFVAILVVAAVVFAATYRLWKDGYKASAYAILPLDAWLVFASYLAYATM